VGDESGAASCKRALARTDLPKELSIVEILTPREREVAALVARGLTDRDIAAVLGIAHGTAGRHVTNIMTSLDVHSRAQIAVWAVANGLGPSGVGLS